MEISQLDTCQSFGGNHKKCGQNVILMFEKFTKIVLPLAPFEVLCLESA